MRANLLIDGVAIGGGVRFSADGPEGQPVGHMTVPPPLVDLFAARVVLDPDVPSIGRFRIWTDGPSYTGPAGRF
jgi:hypothetical protein